MIRMAIKLEISRRTLLIVIIGIVSLFADFVYEGGRSIGPLFFTTGLGGSVSKEITVPVTMGA